MLEGVGGVCVCEMGVGMCEFQQVATAMTWHDPTRVSCHNNRIYLISLGTCMSKLAIQQYIRHRVTLNSNSNKSNLREHCKFAAERCCLSLKDIWTVWNSR